VFNPRKFPGCPWSSRALSTEQMVNFLRLSLCLAALGGGLAFFPPCALRLQRAGCHAGAVMSTRHPSRYVTKAAPIPSHTGAQRGEAGRYSR
jgi:hypothetical protein